MSIEYIDRKHARLCYSIGSGKDRKRYTKRITYKNKTDAKNQYDKFVESISFSNDELTVKKLIKDYISEKEMLGLKATTKHAYNIALKRLISRFNGILATDLTLLPLQDFILLETKSVSPKTIKNEISLLNSAYKNAIRKGLLKENPCEFVVLPKQEKRDPVILNKKNIDNFVKDADCLPDYLKLTCYLALFCGMRKSEILGITNKDVNLNFHTISINKSRHVVEGKMIIQTTKTETSNRIITYPNFMHELIKRNCTDKWLVNIDTVPVNPNTLDKHFRQFIGRKYGITIHKLRHTHASLLHDKGIPLAEISSQLGHSNINTTLAIYTHTFDTTRSSRIADLMDEMSPKSHHKEKEA